jgi:hypothetical protein
MLSQRPAQVKREREHRLHLLLVSILENTLCHVFAKNALTYSEFLVTNYLTSMLATRTFADL